MVALARPRGVWLRSRLDPYGRLEGGAAAAATLDASPGWRPSAERVYGGTERTLESTRVWRSTMRLLERAGSQLRPAELLWQCLLLGVGLAVDRSALISSSFWIALGIRCAASALPGCGCSTGHGGGCAPSRTSSPTC